MDSKVPVSRTWLESLSTEELIKLADTYGIDIPPGLERIFTIEEILESSEESEPEPENEIIVNPSYTDTAQLPKQYNISFVDVIIRDPLWVFVTWEVKGHDREQYENTPGFNGYFLRVIPIDEEEAESTLKELSFTVSISADDNARYLGFAEHSCRITGSYIIKLGVSRGDSELHIASSQPFCLPKLNENEILSDMKNSPLISLSGVQELQIIRNTDRQSRNKRQ